MMKSILRFGILFVVAGLLLVVVALGCERQATTEASAEYARLEDGPDQESWNVRFAVYNDERARAEIRAPYMAQFVTEDSTYTVFRADPEQVESGRVSAQLYNEEGDSTAVIWSNILTYLEDDDRFEAEGDVQVETVDGKQIEAEHLAWYEEERRVRTPGFVRIITPTDRIQGYGLVATEDLSSYELADVTGETEVEEL